MSYLAYKRTFWPLMLAMWEGQSNRTPFVESRITFAQEQIAEWASPEMDRRFPG